ncbi:hypothetical protein WJX84_011873 [Apatococcus fuscideae]|uniref:Uncharacterized protein n=1 Tax=Apatococcus fuscideae TaxID=2026836 RepID=A0AAW1TAI5_9CHLO
MAASMVLIDVKRLGNGLHVSRAEPSALSGHLEAASCAELHCRAVNAIACRLEGCHSFAAPARGVSERLVAISGQHRLPGA